MANTLEDLKVNIKLKLAALWTSLMFCYVYGDFFSLFVPGRIQRLIDGESGAGETTPVMLLLYAVLLALPALMIFFSVTLKARLNRLLNIIMGVFFTLVMILVVLTSLSEWMVFYTFLGVIEIILTVHQLYGRQLNGQRLNNNENGFTKKNCTDCRSIIPGCRTHWIVCAHVCSLQPDCMG
jgi:hypothetical protein